MFNKSLLITAVCAGLASTSSQAADGTFGLAFRTVPDVSITQVQGLSFGSNLKLGVSSTCTLVVGSATTDAPSNVLARQGLGASRAAGTSYQTRTGDCDNSGLGTAGIYRVTGAEGVNVTITVNAITPGAGDFSFVPVAMAVDNVTGASNDLLEDLVAAGSNKTGVVRLASATDTAVSGSPIPGQTLIFVGGQLTAQNQLTAGTTYNTQQFVIDVVY